MQLSSLPFLNKLLKLYREKRLGGHFTCFICCVFFADNSGESTSSVSLSQEISSPHLPKQGSPFYAEPADSLMPPQITRKTCSRFTETPIPTSNSISPLQSFRLVNFRVKPDRERNEGIVVM